MLEHERTGTPGNRGDRAVADVADVGVIIHFIEDLGVYSRSRRRRIDLHQSAALTSDVEFACCEPSKRGAIACCLRSKRRTE